MGNHEEGSHVMLKMNRLSKNKNALRVAEEIMGEISSGLDWHVYFFRDNPVQIMFHC